jgi:hypothetical protein
MSTTEPRKPWHFYMLREQRCWIVPDDIYGSHSLAQHKHTLTHGEASNTHTWGVQCRECVNAKRTAHRCT